MVLFKQCALRSMASLVVTAVLLSGCSRTDEYSPAADADGKATFNAACIGCHEAKSEDVHFEIGGDKATLAAVKEVITQGGFPMPAFPNIQGEALDQLAQYVISVNKPE